MRKRVWAYRQGSKSAKALATALGGRVLKRNGSTFVFKTSDVAINWGDPDAPRPATPGLTLFNYCDLRAASNKKTFFQKMKEEHSDLIPEFWTDRSDIPADVYPVVCRTTLAGHSGEGIVIADTVDQLVDAPLYTRYVKKKDEYRVHCGLRNDGIETIAVQRKARKSAVPDEQVNWKVRNLAGGFIYQREGFTVPSIVIEAAHHSLRTAGIDFGAVDILFNEHEGKAYAIEINTAPGLEGQTVDDYASFFQGT